MGSRISVLEGVSPRIWAEPVDIRATPFLIFARGRFHEHFQSFFGGGVSVHVYVEPFQSGLQRSYAGFGSADLGVVFCGHELRDDGRRQNAEDDDHHHDLDQGESTPSFSNQRFFHSILYWFFLKLFNGRPGSS